MENNRYSQMADEKVIGLYRDGDNDAMDYILDKYKNVVRSKARTMFIIGGENDDLIQEGMIGLYKAIRDYNMDKEASFATFASVCINRQIYTAVNASNRKKHSPLNTYVSISGLSKEDTDIEAVNQHERNPEDLFIDKENVSMIEYSLERELSKFEKEVLRMYIEGAGYVEIAERMDKKPKSIDNALQRIKSKVHDILAKSL